MLRQPLKRKTRLTRKKRLARISARRAEELRAYAVIRRSVLRKAGGHCARCKARRKLDVHHITPRSRGSLLGPCVALCRRCHDEIHFGRPEDREQWIR